MRIFVALDIEEAIRERIARFMEGVRGFAPDTRWVRPESLHVTLKFLGEKSPEVVEDIKKLLAGVRSVPLDIAFQGYGFFPTPKSARIFWVGIEAGPQLTALAAAVDDAAQIPGIPAEDHAFSPHLTLARGGRSRAGRRPSSDAHAKFQRLQERLAGLPQPEFGTMTAREFFLYESKVSPAASKYTKLERFPLT